MGDRRCQPALELIVIIAVQEVMLAVVLIVDDAIGSDERRLKGRACWLALLAAAIAVAGVRKAAPRQIAFRQIIQAGPGTAVDQCLQAGTIGAGFRPEHSWTRTGRSRGMRDARSLAARLAARPVPVEHRPLEEVVAVGQKCPGC